MDEILKKLFESEVLTADTKSELKEAIQKTIDQVKAKTIKETEAKVRASLANQWVSEKETLIEAIDAKVTDLVEAEITELKSDIQRFRDLEADYAKKLVITEKKMAKEVQSDINELVGKLDTFVELRLQTEMKELKEDLRKVRENQFGRKLYEAFSTEFAQFGTSKVTQQKAATVEAKFKKAMAKLTVTERAYEQLKRKTKLDSVLAPLGGRNKEVMRAILKNVPTDQLSEGYRTFIGRVLKESDRKNSEKETPVLAEGKKAVVKPTVKVTGDQSAPKKLTEAVDDETAHMLKLAGITQ